MENSYINQQQREEAEKVMERYLENPDEFEDVTDEFLPPEVQQLFGDWLRDECTQEEFISQLEELSTKETGLLFIALRNHYEDKLKQIRKTAQPEIPA